MKAIKFLLITLILVTITSCQPAGETTVRLTGEEQNLPDELKGLKVYTVSIGEGNYVKVAVLNGQVNSSTYSEGKSQHTTVVINKDRYNERVIEVEEILSETDDIIVIKKKK
jgi:hypothetical protein